MSFYNDFARNIITFDVDNGSSSHSEIFQNIFFLKGKDPTFAINGRFESPDIRFDVNFSKVNTKVCLSLHYNHDNSYICLLMEKKSSDLKLTIKTLFFRLNFGLEVFPLDLVLLILEKYLEMEMCLNNQTIIILLINLI